MEQDKPEVQEEYVPGMANGRHYMARLLHGAGGIWSIDQIHVEGLPPLGESGATWPTRDEAVQAANQQVAALAH